MRKATEVDVSLTSEQARSAYQAPAAQRAVAPTAAAGPVGTVTGVARPVAAAAADAAPMASPPPAIPRVRRPQVIAAAAQAAPEDTVAPPSQMAGQHPSAPLPLLRIVCWEIAVMVGLLAIGRPWPEAVSICAGAAVLLAVTAVRIQENWVSTIMLRWVLLLLRKRVHHLDQRRARPAALLGLLAPGSQVTEHELAGAPVGAVSRPGEMLTVLRPVDTGVRQLVHAALSGELEPGSDPEGAEVGLQLVLHRGPHGGSQTRPRAWLVIRALREVDLLDDDDLRVALSNTLRRTQRKLRRSGLTVASLSEQEILATVTALTHIGPGREQLRERWRSFSAGPVTQIGLQVNGLAGIPPQHRAGALERMVASVPHAAVTVSVTTEAGEPKAVLRVAASSAVVADGSIAHLSRVSPTLGLQMSRLDGLHTKAVAASLPIGGTPL